MEQEEARQEAEEDIGRCLIRRIKRQLNQHVTGASRGHFVIRPARQHLQRQTSEKERKKHRIQSVCTCCARRKNATSNNAATTSSDRRLAIIYYVISMFCKSVYTVQYTARHRVRLRECQRARAFRISIVSHALHSIPYLWCPILCQCS